MKKLMANQQGFIPMMICILAVIIGVIYLGYRVVANGQN
jgi:type II secretory pathway component PulF